MFLQTPKDMYDKYHHATNDGAREYWYKCLQVRLQTGVEHEKVRYYLNRIDKAVLAKNGAGGGWTGEVTQESINAIRASLRESNGK